MNSSLNQVHVENGSTNAMSMQRKQFVNVFDLMKVGLSSTLAVAIFIGIGYVVRHVAGPSAIISILIAAFIAYLVGKIEFHAKFKRYCVHSLSFFISLSLPPSLFPSNKEFDLSGNEFLIQTHFSN